MRPPAKPTAKADKIPPGWYKRRDLEKAWGVSMSYCNVLIRRGIKDGSVKVKLFQVPKATGTMYPTPHYSFKD